MRWVLRFAAAVVVAWVLFALSPYLALYRLAQAVERRDGEAIEERVNFRGVRLSLTRQLVAAYLIATGRGAELKQSSRELIVNVGATIVDPLVAELASPAALMDLLQGSAQAARTAGAAGARADFGSVRALGQLFLNADTHGFRAIRFLLPVDRPREEQFRLQFRLSRGTWRLVGIELPAALRDRLVQEIIRANPAGS
jgi:Protein of unknown function (DUF2939)